MNTIFHNLRSNFDSDTFARELCKPRSKPYFYGSVNFIIALFPKKINHFTFARPVIFCLNDLSTKTLEVKKIFFLDVGADFVTKIFDYFSDLLYQKIIALLGDFFSVMNATGYDLFGLPWVRQIVQLFSNLGWALFVVGIVVALFEFAIESQNGRGDPKALALNIIKGFFAVNLFCTVPVQLYGFTVALQSSMSGDMTGLISPEGSGTLLNACLDVINGFLFGPLLGILIAIMMGYSVIKVFFASIKRGGILLIQIAIGSLYMFSVPRGFNDGFVMWVKQVIDRKSTRLNSSHQQCLSAA